jgi:hypothetical protein
MPRFLSIILYRLGGDLRFLEVITEEKNRVLEKTLNPPSTPIDGVY